MYSRLQKRERPMHTSQTRKKQSQIDRSIHLGLCAPSSRLRMLARAARNNRTIEGKRTNGGRRAAIAHRRWKKQAPRPAIDRPSSGPRSKRSIGAARGLFWSTPSKRALRQISGPPPIGWRERQARGKQGLVHMSATSHVSHVHPSTPPHRHAIMGLEPPLQRQQEPGPTSAPQADGGGAADRVEQVCMEQRCWLPCPQQTACAAMHGGAICTMPLAVRPYLWPVVM